MIEVIDNVKDGKVVYTAKDGKSVKVFPAMEWLAAMCSHIPNRGEQMVYAEATSGLPLLASYAYTGETGRRERNGSLPEYSEKLQKLKKETGCF